MSFLLAENLTKAYGDNGTGAMALRQASFQAAPGEFIAVMGPSGSGKSTLLSIMGALNTPTKGRWVVDDIDVYGLSPERRADFRREYIGFIFQDFHLVPYLNMLENVMLPLAVKRAHREDKIDLARQAIAKVGLTGKENRLPSQISGGEQERVAIARAIVNHPPILLADEPTGNLDQATGEKIMNQLKALCQDGATVIMVTHNPGYANIAQRVLMMSDGILSDLSGSMASGQLSPVDSGLGTVFCQAWK